MIAVKSGKQISKYLILLLLVIAFALQSYGLAEDSLWGDEIFTAIFAAKSPTETIAFTASDIHPPLYYLLAGALSHTPFWPQGTPGSTTDWLWRWPSLLAGVFTIAITYRLGTLLVNQQVGLIAALLLSLAPIALKYNQEARMHALFMMLSALSTLFLILALRQNKNIYWVGYIISTILNLYTMYFAFLIITSHTLVVGWQGSKGAKIQGNKEAKSQGSKAAGCQGCKKAKGQASKANVSPKSQITVEKQPNANVMYFWDPATLKPWLLGITIALFAYLPWWPVLWRILTFRAQVGAVEGGVGTPGAFLLKVIGAIGPFGYSAWLFFGVYLLGLGVAWLKKERTLFLFGSCWLALPALLPLILGDSRALHLRYAFVLPVYLIFVAWGIVWLAEICPQPGQRVCLGLSLGLLVTLNLQSSIMVYQQSKPNWRQAAAFVAQQAGPADVVVTGPLWDDARFFSYYYPHPEQVMPPPTLAFRLPGVAADMAAVQGRLWLVTRYPPEEMKGFEPHILHGVTVLEQTRLEYDPVRIIDIGANLCKQAAKTAEAWAAEMAAAGVLTPDPRASKATAYLCQGDTYAVTGDYERALKPHQQMVEAFPGWAGGYLTLAKTYLAVDNLSAASAAFEQAVAFNPAWQTSQSEAATTFARQGNWQKAIELYQAAIGE